MTVTPPAYDSTDGETALADGRTRPIRRCHGCGGPVPDGHTWCSTSCFRAEDGGHDDEYDLYEEVA